MNDKHLDEIFEHISKIFSEYKFREPKGIEIPKQYLNDTYDFVDNIDESNSLFKKKDGTEWVFGKLNEDVFNRFILLEISDFDTLNLSLPAIKINKFLEYDNWHISSIYEYIVDRYNIVFDQQSYNYFGGVKVWRTLNKGFFDVDFNVHTYGFNTDSNEYLRDEDGTIIEFDMNTSIWLSEEDKKNLLLVITKDKLE